MIQLLLLSPPVIDRMIRDTKFHRFNFLKNPPKSQDEVRIINQRVGGGCSGCGRKKRKNRRVVKAIPGATDYNSIKESISGLDPQNRTVIKDLLECRQLRIRYRNYRGTHVTSTL